MALDEVIDSLNGKPLIEKVVFYAASTDLFGKSELVMRECRFCMYRDNIPGTKLNDCKFTDKKAHIYFGVKPDEILPQQINGNEVGNFCPFFIDYVPHNIFT